MVIANIIVIIRKAPIIVRAKRVYKNQVFRIMRLILGYDLFTKEGQGGVVLKHGESGEHLLDNIRFNKSCVPRHCSDLKAPENGKIVSINDQYFFPVVIEFKCNFGHQVI